MSVGTPVTIIGPTVLVRGAIRGSDDLVVEGGVEGRIELEGNLDISARGYVRASLHARRVRVAGVVWGDIVATQGVEICAGARVIGDIRAPRVRIALSSVLHGTLYEAVDEVGDAPPLAPTLPVEVAVPGLRSGEASEAPSAADAPDAADAPAPSWAPESPHANLSRVPESGAADLVVSGPRPSRLVPSLPPRAPAIPAGTRLPLAWKTSGPRPR